ncbi:alpha/beta hydrolase [Actinomadura rubrobrunea]|uniref:Alpha/beta hydrolase n=1 Tax=Actinomadura rubrobrunea TaxID=115335 RepID=A0A9W6US53_9ACTN|nr:alpha/beta hydrolase [Actinomadura rubrobrunea]GLW62296.1 alpha/beta hydrolase [Actinomadura rubrobrunea]
MSTPRFLTLPPNVHRTYVETPRGRFAALEGLPGSGVPERCPALLVPGYTGSKEDFLAILQPLADAGRRRVVAIDMRGQYESPGCDDPSRYTCGALGEDVASLVQALGPDPVHLVGHSFGGLVTRETVLSGQVRLMSYTLMSSGPASVGGPSAAKARALMEAIPQLGMDRIWSLTLEPDARARGLAPEIIDFLKARTLGNCELGLRAMAAELLSAPDRVDELAKAADDAGLPILVLYGEDDDVWEPPEQAAMAERLDAAKVVIPGAAHSPAVEAPETTAGALTDFWNRSERSCRSL